MHDLEERLRSLTFETPMLADDAIGARVGRRHRRRRILTASVATSILVVTVASLVVMSSDDDASFIAPATEPPETTMTPSSTAVTSTTAATSTTAIPSTTVEPLVDLSGVDGGLYIDPAVLTDDLELVEATRADGPVGGSNSAGVVSETTLGSYSPDRSRIIDTITITTFSVADGRPPESLRGGDGEHIQLRGLTAWATGVAVIWAEGPWIVDVTSGAAELEDVDMALLIDTANHVAIDDDGRTTVDPAPPGYEPVSTLPGTIVDSGPQWRSDYRTPDITPADFPMLIVQLTTHPGTPAEAALTDLYGDATAIEVLGRRAVLRSTPRMSRPGVEIVWDEPDGSQISVSYAPVRADVGTDEIRAEAIRLANGVRRASPDAWTDLSTAADRARYVANAMEWIPALVAERGLVAGQPAPLQLWGLSPAAVFVPVTHADGTDAGVCEIFLREVTACTPPDDPMVGSRGADVHVGLVEGGYLRVMVGPDAPYVSITARTGSSTQITTAIFDTSGPFDESTSPRVVYLPTPTSGAEVCLGLSDANGHVVASYPLSSGVIAGDSGSCTPELGT